MRVEAAALTQPMHCGHPPWPAPWNVPARHPVRRTAGRPRETGAATHQRDHPIDHHVAETTAVSRTEVRPGARATRTRRSPTPLPEEPMN
jgi:hypothetical protein